MGWFKRYQGLFLLLVAVSILLLGFIFPSMLMQKTVLDAVFVVDITQSMNARDYQQDDESVSRLDMVKQSLRYALQHLPCGSQIGIGLFAAKDALLLFNPIEVCEHYSVLDQVIKRIDWRMSWAGDSNVQRGLYSAVGQQTALTEPTTLFFFTDGEQTVSEQYAAPLNKRAGLLRGALVGVGGNRTVRIPKYNEQNELIGFWQNDEVGKQKKKSKRNRSSSGDDYLSRLDQVNLASLAAQSQLNLFRLDTPQQLTDELLSDAYTTKRIEITDIRWITGVLVLLLLLLPILMRQIKAMIMRAKNP